MDQQADPKTGSVKEQDPLEHRSDQELVQAFQGGVEEAFEEIVHRYKDYIFRNVYYQVSNREVAEDLAQQTFVNAYEGLEDFELRSSLKTWLYRIAKNLCYSHHRKRGRNREQPVGLFSTNQSGEAEDEPGFPEPGDRSNNPRKNLTRQEKREFVQNLISRMNEKHRTVLTLREYEDHSYEEISDLLDVAVGTVRSRLYRARKKLQERIEEEFGDSLDEFLRK